MRARTNRHGRPIRGRISPNLPGRNPQSFEDIVASTCRFLQDEWPDELGKLRWRVTDMPADLTSNSVARWSADESKLLVTIYRVPVERMTHIRRTDPADERFHIEQFVFTAAASMIGKDPWDLLPERFRR